MAKFEIEYSTRVPGIAEMPRGDMGGGLVAEALARAGGALANFGEAQRERAQRAETENRKNQIYSETQNGKIGLQEYDSETKKMLQGVTDLKEIERIGQERLQERSLLLDQFSTLPESREALDFYTRQTAIGQVEHIETERYNRGKQNAFISFDTLYQSAASEGSFDVLEPLAKQAYEQGVITDHQYLKYAGDVKPLQDKHNFESIRGQTQDYVTRTSDKKGAYAIIQQAYDDGIIDAKANKELGDSLDNFVQGRIQQDANNRYAVTMDNYRAFTEKVQKGELSFDAIRNTPMTEDDKGKWEGYVKGSYAAAPTKSVAVGHTQAVGIVMQHNTKRLSEKEALDALLHERYVKNSLSEDEFKWALNRIQNPYPAYMMPVIQQTIRYNQEQARGVWRSKRAEQELAQKWNTVWLQWLDVHIESGRWPAPKEMHAVAKQYEAVSYDAPNSTYRVGEEIERGGKTYVVIGFDDDGHPLVEEGN